MLSDYSDLLSILNAHGVRYLIVGAYAVAVHAQPRATKDLDILVKDDPENAKAIFAALIEFGAPMQGLSPADFEEPGVFFRVGREPVSVAIFTSVPGIDLTQRGSGEWKMFLTGRRTSVRTSFHVTTLSQLSGRQVEARTLLISKQSRRHGTAPTPTSLDESCGHPEAGGSRDCVLDCFS